jgi:hypothetical protein
VTQEWNGAAKPAMSGEAAGSGCNATSLFATMANGACMNPMWWQYNQGTNTSADMTAESNFATFVNGINFAGFSNLSKATVTGGGATAYGIKGDQGRLRLDKRSRVGQPEHCGNGERHLCRDVF